jgi:hypothetical protein
MGALAAADDAVTVEAMAMPPIDKHNNEARNSFFISFIFLG